MAERTLKDITDEMSPSQRELMDLVVGAAVDDVDLSGDEEVLRQFQEDLTEEHVLLICFVVGHILSDTEMSHVDIVGDFLEHYGIKGMRWGIRKDDSTSGRTSMKPLNTRASRTESRRSVKAGNATLGDAHVAALKSKGHRVTNAFLGDKTYWKRTAAIAGVTTAAAATSVLAPWIMPASILAPVGAATAKAAGMTVIGGKAVAGAGLVYSTADLGALTLAGAGLKISAIGAAAAQGVNQVTNVARAVTSNARIRSSYEKLGNMMTARQTEGTKRVNKILTQGGSLRKKDLKHEENLVDDSLSHRVDDGEKSGKGGGNFDESKVKRDGHGRFSKKAEKSYYEMTDDEKRAYLEKLWMSKERLRELKFQILGLASDKIDEVVKSVAKKLKYDPLKHTPQEQNRFDAEIKKAVVPVLNEVAKEHGVSPTGTKRLEYYVGPRGGLKHRIIPYNGTPMKIIDDRASDRVVAQISSSNTLPKRRKSGGMFNPEAVLDTSRVSDASDSSSSSDSDDDEDESFFYRLFHGDISEVDSFLEHYGIKGMRWGLRKSDDSSGGNATSGAHPSPTTVKKAKEQVVKDGLRKAAGTITGLKNASKYKGKDLNKDPKLRAEYDAEVKATLRSAFKTTGKYVAVSGAVLTISATFGPPAGMAAVVVANQANLIFGKSSRTTGPRANSLNEKLTLTHKVEHSDLTEYGVYYSFDEHGFVVDMQIQELELTHDEVVGDFLEHYGVKGMRWGIRKDDSSGGGGRLSRIKAKLTRKSSGDKDDDEEGGSSSSGGGSSSGGAKRAEDMTTAELQAFNARHEALKKYNAIINPDPKAELQARIDMLNLQRQYASLHREMNPTRSQKIQRFIKNRADEFQSFNRLDKQTGGALSAALGNTWRTSGKGKHRGTGDLLTRVNAMNSPKDQRDNMEPKSTGKRKADKKGDPLLSSTTPSTKVSADDAVNNLIPNWPEGGFSARSPSTNVAAVVKDLKEVNTPFDWPETAPGPNGIDLDYDKKK